MQTIGKYLAVYILLGLMLIACSTTADPSKNPPGFLPNYSLLKPVTDSSESMLIYNYTDPKVDPHSYYGVIIESVTLNQQATPDGVTQEQIEQVRYGIESGIKQLATKRFKVVSKPDKGVFRLYVGITGASIQQDGFHIWNFLPIGAAIKLASMATGLNSKRIVLVVEMKFIDSVSNKLLKETVATINSEDFRLNSSTPEEFQQSAITWVQRALQNSTKISYEK